ncbi:MAG: phospholipase D-like domain-containing protein [Candidatus Thermoplasmatota archaeon]|nr:phospholipase D-like domain-containing protein [Candidatus Thermoplasmatota archaeon]
MAIEGGLNLLDEIRKVKDSELIVFLTFTFDPLFFDNSIYKILKKKNPDATIIVFVDYKIYSDILEECTDITGKDYILLPIKSGAFFHPKIFLFYSEKKPVAYVGSHNLTLSGIAYNLETTVKIEEKPLCQMILSQIQDLLEEVIKDEDNFLLQKIRSFTEGAEIEEAGDIKILNNLKKSLLDQMINEINDMKFEQFTVIAPYFSKTKELIEKITNQIDINKVSITIDRDHHNLNPAELSDMKNISFNEIKFREKRRLHSKIMVFQGEKNCLMIGSPNFTKSALSSEYSNGNFESCVLIKNVRDVDKLFSDCILSELSPKDIKPTISSFLGGERTIGTESTITFAYLDRITNQIHINSDAKKECTVFGKTFDGNEKELRINSRSYGVIKISAEEESLPKEIWFVDKGKRISNKCRVFYALSKLDTLPQYRNKPDKINKLIWKMDNLPDILSILYSLFGQEEKKSIREGEKGIREYVPSPARLPSTHHGEDIFSLLEKFIRTGSRRKVIEVGIPKDIETKEDLDEEESEGGEETYQIDYEKKVDQILKKINDGFSEVILPEDSSVSRYVQYILICLKLTYFFEVNFTINKDRHLIQILQSFNELMNNYELENFTQEEVTQLLSFEMFVLSEISDSTLRGYSYQDIPYSQFGETILSLSFDILEDPDKISIFNDFLKEFGLKNIRMNDLQQKYFPSLIAHTCAKLSKDGRENYLKNLIERLKEEDKDKKTLAIFLLLSEIAKISERSSKKVILDEVSKIEEDKQSRFKKGCITDLKDICNR